MAAFMFRRQFERKEKVRNIFLLLLYDLCHTFFALFNTWKTKHTSTVNFKLVEGYKISNKYVWHQKP
jgi:hypothetical protein